MDQRLKLPQGASIKLLGFCAIMLVVYLADAIMSYTAPAFIEENVANPFLMGIIIASSSTVGIVADFLIGAKLRGRRSRFFVATALVFSISFPATFLLLPSSIPTFILAMAIWGIYYELMHFSNYHFIGEHSHASQHAMMWGVLSVARAAAYTFGPLVASTAVVYSVQLPFQIALLLASVSFVAVLGYMFVMRKHRVGQATEIDNGRNLFAELKIWSLLGSKVWHLFAFLFALSLTDATFWTVGVLLSEELQNGTQGLLFVLYGIPALLFGGFIGYLARPFGKKRAAFISALLGGIFLIVMGVVQNEIAILTAVFVASSFLAISWPEVNATFEDYVSRLGKTGNEFIGLQSSIISLSYIVGPIIAGGIASLVGNQLAFAVVGGFLVLTSIFSLIIVPRKIHMPQKELRVMEAGSVVLET
jgi:MFS family permease